MSHHKCEQILPIFTNCFLSSVRPYPMHDSPSIILLRSGTYHKHLSSVKEWYSSQYGNWHAVDAERNKWHVWNECNNAALHSALQIQQYLIRTTEGNL